jgi:large subunit ribosomal protein L21
MAEQKEYDQREHMEQVISEGGSVYHRGRIIARQEELPADSVLARGNREMESAARRRLERQRAAIEEELSALNTPDDTSDDSGARGGNAGNKEGSDDLSELTVVELRERAKVAGVEGYSTMNKADLVAVLKAQP